MKKSMNIYFGKGINTKEKLDYIKKIGFDEFFTGYYDKNETMTWKEQIEYAKSIGLDCTMLHCSYKEPLLDSFWLEGETGDFVENDFKKQILACGNYVKNFVVHLNGSKNCVVSNVGLERIKRLLAVCEQYGLNFCVENLYIDTEIPFIFKNISHPLLKICYDCGHKNFLTPNFDLCKDYGKYVTCLHLHENDGTKDEHKTLVVGSKVYGKLQNDLKYLDKDISLASEARAFSENWRKCVKENLNVFKTLDESLRLDKNKTNNNVELL